MGNVGTLPTEVPDKKVSLLSQIFHGGSLVVGYSVCPLYMLTWQKVIQIMHATTGVYGGFVLPTKGREGLSGQVVNLVMYLVVLSRDGVEFLKLSAWDIDNPPLHQP